MGQKILVVEDNELNLKLFCDLLRAHGYTAEPVRDGREAVDRARAFAPDLVVMDIQMPHISGLELIEQLKADAELRRVPIMAVTAYAAKGDEERIREAGAEGYVSKPISVIRFVEAVRALLAAPRADPSEAQTEEERADMSPRTGRRETGEGEAPSAAYRLFAWAIENRKRVACVYDERPREICPIILGHSEGAEKALVWQTGGETRNGPIEAPDWKCFVLSKVTNVEVREGEWGAGTSHQQAQSCVEKVDYDVNEASPYGPTCSLGRLREVPLEAPPEPE